MKHDLTPDIVEQLERRYQEDLAKTRALCTTPWQQHTSVDKFEDNRPASQRWRAPLISAVVVWLGCCGAISLIVNGVDSLATRIASAGPVHSFITAIK